MREAINKRYDIKGILSNVKSNKLYNLESNGPF